MCLLICHSLLPFVCVCVCVLARVCSIPLETDPQVVSQRVALRSEESPFNDQTVTQVGGVSVCTCGFIYLVIVYRICAKLVLSWLIFHYKVMTICKVNLCIL